MSETNSINENLIIWKLVREEDRLKTFDSWTNNDVDKAKLAKFGFYYKGPNDIVKCVYCEVIIRNWSIGDDPLMEHIQMSPSCPFLLRNRPINIAIDSNFETQLPSPEYFVPIVENNNNDNINISEPTHRIMLSEESAIRHPAYHSQENRLKSFNIWPKSLPPSPQSLSEAGFFYTAIGDQVKCFYCGGGLRNWKTTDEPWNEHAKHYGTCKFVMKWKSEQFIKEAINNNVDVTNYTGNSVIFENEKEALIAEPNSTLSKKCNICLKEELNAIFCPCYHIYACTNCATSKTRCPICHEKIVEIKKCFLS